MTNDFASTREPEPSSFELIRNFNFLPKPVVASSLITDTHITNTRQYTIPVPLTTTFGQALTFRPPKLTILYPAIKAEVQRLKEWLSCSVCGEEIGDGRLLHIEPQLTKMIADLEREVAAIDGWGLGYRVREFEGRFRDLEAYEWGRWSRVACKDVSRETIVGEKLGEESGEEGVPLWRQRSG